MSGAKCSDHHFCYNILPQADITTKYYIIIILLLTVIINKSFDIDIDVTDPDQFQDNRTGVELGSTVTNLLNCSVTYTTLTNTPAIQTLWIRNGNVVTEDSDHIFSNLGRTLQINNFSRNDTGVYQCIFNANSTSEVLMTRPFRLQTGGYNNNIIISMLMIIIMITSYYID